MWRCVDNTVCSRADSLAARGKLLLAPHRSEHHILNVPLCENSFECYMTPLPAMSLLPTLHHGDFFLRLPHRGWTTALCVKLHIQRTLHTSSQPAIAAGKCRFRPDVSQAAFSCVISIHQLKLQVWTISLMQPTIFGPLDQGFPYRSLILYR